MTGAHEIAKFAGMPGTGGFAGAEHSRRYSVGTIQNPPHVNFQSLAAEQRSKPLKVGRLPAPAPAATQTPRLHCTGRIRVPDPPRSWWHWYSDVPEVTHAQHLRSTRRKRPKTVGGKTGRTQKPFPSRFAVGNTDTRRTAKFLRTSGPQPVLTAQRLSRPMLDDNGQLARPAPKASCPFRWLLQRGNRRLAASIE